MVLLSVFLAQLLLAGSQSAWQPTHCGEGKLPEETRHVLVITVADWRDPLLSYVGERERDTVVAALAEAGFIITRDGEGLDETRDHRLQHGIFHRWKSDHGSAWLELILVPESPITGVDLDTMEEALDCAREVEPKELFVLGPTYSGSAWSIGTAIKRSAHGRARHVRVVSGSATGADLGHILEAGGPPGGDTLQFERTVHSNVELFEAVRNYLTDKESVEGLRLAILTEQSSAYGNDMRSNLQPDRERTLDADREKSPPDAGSVLADGGYVPVLILPFPMHIAWRLGEDALLPSPDAGRPLDVQLPEGVERSAAEAALAQLLATISMDDYRYVGIVATDVRDRLFLTRRIHAYSPDVRIIFFESDVLYALTSFAETRGSLVASTYPLLNENQLWASTNATDAGPLWGTRRQFESDPAEGAYNATLYLLRRMDFGGRTPLVEYRPPFRSSFVDAGLPAIAARPPVWISIQGGRQAWPLEMVPPDSGRELVPDDVDSAVTASWTSDFPGAFHLFAILLALGVLATALWYLCAPHSKALLGRASSLPAVTTPVEISCQGAPSRLVCTAYVVSWLLWAWVLAKLFDLWFRRGAAGNTDHPKIHIVLGIPLGLALVASLLCSAVALFGGVVPELGPRRRSYASSLEFVRRHWVWWALSVAVGCAGLATLTLGLDGEPFRFELSRQRYVHLASGVSPLLLLYFLLLFVGVGAFGISTYSASRRAYGRPRTVQWPLKRPKVLVEKLVIPSNASNLLTLATALVAGLVIAWAVLSRLNKPLEEPVVGYLIHALIAFAPAGVILSCALALIRWSTVRSCLRGVVFSHAFSSAPAPPAAGSVDSLSQPRSLLFSPQPPLREAPPTRRSGSFPFAYLSLEEHPFPSDWQIRLMRTLQEEFVLIRRLFIFPLAGPPLVMLGMASYPIEPNRLLLLLFSLLLATFVMLAFYLVMAVEREPMVAALEQRTSGAFDFSPAVLVRIAALAIPLLFAIFGSRLPALGASTLDAVQQLASLVK